VLNARTPRADVTLGAQLLVRVFKKRRQLLAYSGGAAAKLKADARLILSMYGRNGIVRAERRDASHPRNAGVDGTRLPAFRYIWDQESFNPLTHEVFCSITSRSRATGGCGGPSSTTGACGPCPRS
jgi:hypothetical protein